MGAAWFYSKMMQIVTAAGSRYIVF